MELKLSTSRLAPLAARSGRARRNPPQAQGPDAREARMRESGVSQDVAHYGCGCGFQFTARVAMTVACPHCGAYQAW